MDPDSGSIHYICIGSCLAQSSNLKQEPLHALAYFKYHWLQFVNLVVEYCIETINATVL